jgi:hypothetical protein
MIIHSHTTTVGRTPLDEWSARRKDLYLTKHNTHNRETSMPSAGFEPKILTGCRLQTLALDSSATGTGSRIHTKYISKTVYKIWVCSLTKHFCLATESTYNFNSLSSVLAFHWTNSLKKGIIIWSPKVLRIAITKVLNACFVILSCYKNPYSMSLSIKF